MAIHASGNQVYWVGDSILVFCKDTIYFFLESTGHMSMQQDALILVYS